MGGHGVAEGGVGAGDDEEVEIGGRQLDAAAGVEAAGEPPVEVRQV